MSAVAVDGVWKFYGDFPALRDVRLEAEQDRAALIGRNGAGKTTLRASSRAFRGRGEARYGYSAMHRAKPKRGGKSGSSATGYRSTTSCRRWRT